MRRRTALSICSLICGIVLILPVYAFVYSQEAIPVTQTILSAYRGVKAVQVTGSVPNEMDSSQFGCFGAVFWNPTSDVYQLTLLEFNASSAINRVFRGITQGRGFSYPASGWRLNVDRKTVYLSTSIIVQPHSAQEFYVSIRGNKETEAFQVDVRATANNTEYYQTYSTQQVRGDVPFSVLWLGNRPTPQFMVSAQREQETTFYVSLQEASDNGEIISGGKLTLELPPEFTGIQDVGGTGWGSATIVGNRVEVSNTLSIRNSYLTYAFKAVAPTYKGLYTFDASFSGAPNENPVANFCVEVTDGA
jgi:hypothetical protein